MHQNAKSKLPSETRAATREEFTWRNPANHAFKYYTTSEAKSTQTEPTPTWSQKTSVSSLFIGHYQLGKVPFVHATLPALSCIRISPLNLPTHEDQQKDRTTLPNRPSNK